MKKLTLLKTLLVLIGVLITGFTSRVWATNSLMVSATDAAGSAVTTFDGSNNAYWTSNTDAETRFYVNDGSKCYLNADRTFSAWGTSYQVYKYDNAKYEDSKKMTPILGATYRFSFWGSDSKYYFKYHPYIMVGNGSGNWLGGNNWDETATTIATSVGVTYSDCAAGVKIFRIIPYNDPDQAHGYNQVTSCNVPYVTNGDNNIVFVTNKIANITISFDGSNISITVANKDGTDPKDAILGGDYVMCYFGDAWNDNQKYLNKSAANDYYNAAKFVTINTDNRVAVGVVEKDTKYYVSHSDSWLGHIMDNNVVQGSFYLNYNDGSEKQSATASTIPSISDKTVVVGTTNSGMSATSSPNYSVLGSTYTYSYTYYYTQNEGDTWTEFDPADVDELAIGTYTVRALAYDGHIYLRTNEATLTIQPKVTFSVSPTGAAGAITTDPEISSGDGVDYESDVEFTHAAANAGYTWYRWEDGEGTGLGIGTTYTEEDITESITIVAKYTPNTYTVSFNKGAGRCATSSMEVTMGEEYGELPDVTPPDGYNFVGWYSSRSGGSQVTSSSIVSTASDHTLYARFTEIAFVYFYNNLGWSNVYVTYDATWDNDQGAGNSGKTYHEMERIGETNYYRDEIPSSLLYNSDSWKYFIAFNDTKLSDKYSFNEGKAIFRKDFDKNLTLFIPTNVKTNDTEGNYQKNGVQYYSTGYTDGTSEDPAYTSGYWTRYEDVFSGYKLTWQKNGAGSWETAQNFNASTTSDDTYVYTVTMDANVQYNYAVYKAYSWNGKSDQFRYDSEINSSGCTNLKLVCEANNGWMHTTVAGDYTFTLTLKKDGHMYLSIKYPFAEGDYRVRYDWNDGSDHSHYSEIIPAKASSDSTISVFIHKVAGSVESRSLTIEKCTGITSGTPTWNTSYATIGLTSVSESGVYNFVISQDGSAEATGAYSGAYSGKFYIRTACADGGWDLYKNRADNILTYDAHANGYTHYYCKYIDNNTTNVSFTIATDYSPSICAVHATESMAADASVRLTWDETTNATTRAFLRPKDNSRWLVLHGSDGKVLDKDGNAISASSPLAANELYFTDKGNWVYEVALQAQPGAAASVIAYFNSADKYLVGASDSWQTLLDGSGSGKYPLTATYDFKTNRLTTAWTASEVTVSDALTNVDLMIVRHGQDAGTTLTFGDKGSMTTAKVVGAIELRYDDLVGRVTNWTAASRPLLKYFVSFPFAVNVSDVFGLNSAYGDAYVIEKYDGDERAKKGFFQGDGTETFWKELPANGTMNANEGYCVIFDNDYLNGDVGNIWENLTSGGKVYLYFPAASGEVVINPKVNGSTSTYTVPSHPCEITNTFIVGGKSVSHQNTDSHWNLMGVPTFANTSGLDGFKPVYNPEDTPAELKYYYAWNPSNNQFSIADASTTTFKAMHCYMVQFTGSVTFTGVPVQPASIVSRRAPEQESYKMELQVLDGDAEMINRTYVELRDEANDDFVLCEDVYRASNNKAVEIYTYAGNYDVAANVLSVKDQTVEVGLNVRKAGTYTISMPSAFSGTATLVDTYADTRTNLEMTDYEVNLTEGTCNDRFLIEIKANKMPTAIDGVEGDGSLKDGKAHKFVQDGVMYILQNGRIYNAEGALVK